MTREPIDWPTRDLLSHRAAATPDRVALVDAADGATRTYRELDEAVERTAVGLAGRFVRGGRVGLLMEPRPEFAEVVHAAARVGATLVPLDPSLPAGTLESRVQRADLRTIVCGAETEDLAAAVAGPVDSGAEERAPVATVDEPAGGNEAASRLVRPSVDSELSTFPTTLERSFEQLVVFTSGTTGEPKGVRLTAGNLVASATASAFRLGIRPGDRWLAPIPPHHVGGLVPYLRAALYGTAVVRQPGFDAGETAAAIDEHGVTGVSLVPTTLTRLLDAGWNPPEGLRAVLLGGAPASGELIERCEDRGVPVHPTYGTTETASQVATARPEQAFAHPGTVGGPLVFTEVTVVGDDGDPAGAGERGELVVEGPTVTPGYLDDDATEAAFGPHGLHTGDLGYRDGAGRLWVLGRLDDAVVTGGETVHPSAVADALREHPGVADAAVVGLDDPEWGQRVAALVVPADAEEPADPGEAGAPDPDALAAFCRERLAPYAVPKTWGVVEKLPRTTSGTVDRETVRERLRGQ